MRGNAIRVRCLVLLLVPVLLNRVLAYYKITIAYWSWYADDFLAAWLILLVTRIVFSPFKPAAYRFPWYYLWSFLFMLSFYFEYYLPFYADHGVSDPLDIVAYALGTLSYALVERQERWGLKHYLG